MSISYIPEVSIHSLPCTKKLCVLAVNSPNVTQRDANKGKWTEKVREMAVRN